MAFERLPFDPETHLADVGMFGQKDFGAVYLIDDERRAIIETGTSWDVDRILEAVRAFGLRPRGVPGVRAEAADPRGPAPGRVRRRDSRPRSACPPVPRLPGPRAPRAHDPRRAERLRVHGGRRGPLLPRGRDPHAHRPRPRLRPRSEEHTSELQ